MRRRRACVGCGYRYTTFERSSDPILFVTKRSGEREMFLREKLIGGIRAACKNRPVGTPDIESLADGVEALLRHSGPSVTSQDIGVAVLDRLRELDEVAYLRFVSVYKGFEEAGDFTREVGLLTKLTAPKHHPSQGRDLSPSGGRADG